MQDRVTIQKWMTQEEIHKAYDEVYGEEVCRKCGNSLVSHFHGNQEIPCANLESKEEGL